MVMLYPNILKTFFFKNLNITNFLNQNSQISINYQVHKQKKVKQLS